MAPFLSLAAAESFCLVIPVSLFYPEMSCLDLLFRLCPPPSAPCDGVLLFPSVFVTLTCAFRYGREDLDVLGLTFRKDLFVANVQAFPPPPEEKKSLTRLQERLIKKLGEHAHPFTFEVPNPSHT